MKTILIIKLIGLLLGTLSPDLLRACADKLLDVIEDAVAASPNKIDDAAALPICKMIREAFSIPDNDQADTDAPGPSINA